MASNYDLQGRMSARVLHPIDPADANAALLTAVELRPDLSMEDVSCLLSPDQIADLNEWREARKRKVRRA